MPGKLHSFRWELLISFLVAGSEKNTASLTFDGVDLMGERLADEVFG